MVLVFIRLAFIKCVQTCFLLLIPFLLVESNQGEAGFVMSRFLESLPMLVLGLAGGILVDRVGAARINRLALMAYIAPPLVLVAVYFKHIPAAFLLLVSVAVASITQLLSACGDRVVLDILPPSRLAAYNGTAILIERFCSLGLPLVIGTLAVWDLQATLVLTAAASVLGALLLSTLSPRRDTARGGTQQVSWRSQLRAGFSGLVKNRFLLHLSLITMLVNAVEAVPISFAFLYGHDVLLMNLAEIGLLSTMSGLGGLVAAAIARRMQASKILLLSIFVGSMVVNALIYGAVYVLNNKYALLGAKLIEAFSFVFSAVAYRTLRQENIDKAHYGTLSAAVGFIVKLCIPITILIAGALLVRFSVRDLYLFTAVAELAMAAAVAAWAKYQFIPVQQKVSI